MRAILKKTIGVLVLGLMLVTVSCKNEKKEESEKKGKEFTSAYVCPMHCEGSGSDKEGECPVCGMDYVKNENSINEDTHGNHNHGNEDSEKEKVVSETTEKNETSIEIINAYIQIKNGLVEDSKGNTAKAGIELLNAFSLFDMSKLTNETHKEYMEIMESATEHANHIVKSDITHQREHFEALSKDVNDLVALLGTEKTLYKDFCPMANNNKGAYWLSEIKEIKNPYFGASMLKCGSVKKQIN